MKKIQIVGAFMAALVLSVLAVPGASAAQWLQNGESMRAAGPARTSGTITLAKEGGTLGSGEVECNGVFRGTVGPGAADEISGIENLSGSENGLVACTRISGFCFSPVLHAEKLPWKTELAEELFSTWDHIEGVAYQFLCAIGSVLCSGREKSKFIKNTAKGPEFDFEGVQSGKDLCSDGGWGTITGKGITETGFLTETYSVS